ncbi:MAG: DUF58 domain-containing protein [Planctomycetota bacterium]
MARVRPGLDFSLTGLVFCSMMMFLGLAAINSQASLLFAVFGLMIGVLLVSGVISRWVLRGVSVERRPPDSAQVGRLTRIRYRIDNRKRFWPTFSLTLSELDAGGKGTVFDRQPHAYILHVAGGMAIDVAADIVPAKRGWVELDRLQLSTSFPFGFIKRAIVRRVQDRMLVGPPRAPLEATALDRFYSAESTGLSQRPRPGGNDELYGLREYRPGDSPRDVHWRRSARLLAAPRVARAPAPLVVRQMHRVSPPRLMVVPDTTSRSDTAEAFGVVEKNLAVAASLVAGASDRGLSVGLMLRSASATDGWIERRPERGKRQRRELLRLLAEAEVSVEAETSVEQYTNAATHLVSGDTTGVIVYDGGDALEDPSRAGGRFVFIDASSPMLDQYMRFPESLDWADMSGSHTPDASS